MGSKAPQDQGVEREGFSQVFTSTFGSMKDKSCCSRLHCLRAFYVIIGILTTLLCLVLMAVTLTSAVATKMYSSELSGRLSAMVLLIVTAAFTLPMIIYGFVGVFRKTVKPLISTSAVLITLAIIQTIITGVSLRVTDDDEMVLGRSMIQSFVQAVDNDPWHLKLWATTQHDLTCCGVYSPQDYQRPGVSTVFPPDVPITCCPSYDPGRSELVQEKTRQVCKSKREFFTNGCKSQVVMVFRNTAILVITAVVVLIVFEVIEAILGSVLTKAQMEESGSIGDVPELPSQKTTQKQIRQNSVDPESGTKEKKAKK